MRPSVADIPRRGSPWLALAALLACAGCGPEAPLPPPGAQGPIMIHQWDAAGERQVVVVARFIRQIGSEFNRLELQDVVMRLPRPDGVIYVGAPRGDFHDPGAGRIGGGAKPKPKPEAGTPAPAAADPEAAKIERETAALEGGVSIAWVRDGEPILGRADRASLIGGSNRVEMDNVEWCYRATLTQHARVVFRQDESVQSPGRVSSRPAPPAVIAATAALPRPLDIPAITRDDFL